MTKKLWQESITTMQPTLDSFKTDVWPSLATDRMLKETLGLVQSNCRMRICNVMPWCGSVSFEQRHPLSA